VAAGGKGVNAARTIRRLGGEALCAGFLGGPSGRLIQHLAREEGLPGSWTRISGDTRTCVIVVDSEAGESTVINETGPSVTAADWNRLTRTVTRLARQSECVCISGSLPLNSHPEHFAALLRSLRGIDKPVWVDTSGVALATALSVGVTGLKINQSEAGALVGQVIDSPETASQAASQIRARGVAQVLITLGGQGAVLANDAGSLWASPPVSQVMSDVGSGDAFLGAWVWALSAGQPPPEALRWAVAAGAANAQSFGGGEVRLDDFRARLAEVTVTSLE
jgi:1-phosphofructokinase family hexose kinase